MTTSHIAPCTFIFDINEVLVQRDTSQAFFRFLKEKAKTDGRIDASWKGDVGAVMYALFYKNCPLCEFSLCRVAKVNSTPHIKQELKEGRISYEQLKVLTTQMLTHFVECPPKARIILDYLAEFMTQPALMLRDAQLIAPGVALLEHVYGTHGPENIFLLSNMPAQMFSAMRNKFPDLFELMPEKQIILSGHTGICKPSQDAFTQLVTKFNVDPATALFFDDKQSNITAARDAGFHAVQFVPEGSTELAEWYGAIGYKER